MSSTHLNAIEYCILRLVSHKFATITILPMIKDVNLEQMKHSSTATGKGGVYHFII